MPEDCSMKTRLCYRDLEPYSKPFFVWNTNSLDGSEFYLGRASALPEKYIGRGDKHVEAMEIPVEEMARFDYGHVVETSTKKSYTFNIESVPVIVLQKRDAGVPYLFLKAGVEYFMFSFIDDPNLFKRVLNECVLAGK
jgi:hypothetical protein